MFLAKKFKEITKLDKFPEEVLCTIPNLCKVERSMSLKELKQFAAKYKSFVNTKETAKAQKKERNEDKSEDENLTGSSSESEEKQAYKICQDDDKCTQCLSCAFSVIYELSLSGLFLNLYMAYKYICINNIPCTQVTCERVFSKLKIVKDRLRSTLGLDMLSNLLLMNIERDLFHDINKTEVIDNISQTSSELTRALSI